MLFPRVCDTGDPPVEYDGFTHDPKGRQLKLVVTYQLGH